MFNKFPKRSGVYRINDNIEELQLLLHFRHINSLLKLPKFDFDFDFDLTKNTARKLGELLPLTSDDIQVANIKWQQKILSASEMELYSDASNCHSDTQLRYHEWLREGGGAHVAVNGQPSKELAENEQKLSGKSKSKLKRNKKLEKLKQIENVATDDQVQQLLIFTYTNEDNHMPASINEQQTLKTRTPAPVECMYVYAALQTNTLLIALRWHAADQILHIYPDFTNFHENPYFIEIDADYCHLYAYGFENISVKRQLAPAIENCLSSNFLGFPPPHWKSEQQLTDEFAMPPKRCHRVVLLLEIRTARDFEYDRLHVRYHTQLPTSTILEEGLLEASTHTSSAKSRQLHHLGYSWQLTLLCDQDCTPFTDLCRICFEVISIDSWQRERVEGFAYCSFKLQAATAIRTEQLTCLRPVESFTERLERYFIGGRKKFDYFSFFLGGATVKNKDEQNQSQFHSRYGCRMQRTGELVVSCQQFTQRNCELLHPCAHRKSGMTLDDIMLAYREARKRLEAIVLR